MPEQSDLGAAEGREPSAVRTPSESEIAEALATIGGQQWVFRHDTPRSRAVGYWRAISPESRAWQFRHFAHREIIGAKVKAARAGRYFGRLDVDDFHADAIEGFIQAAVVDRRDNAGAAKRAQGMICGLPYYSRGSIPNALLYMKACGPRVRAQILTDAWTEGNTGSVLALNASSYTMCLTYFKEANPRYLMNAKERRELASLPAVVRLYRGTTISRDVRKAAFALSWTPDYETATKFGRNISSGNGERVVLAADVPRDAIVTWWTESGREIEAIVNPRRVRNVEIVDRFARAAA